MKVTILGCWAPYPRAKGACSSYLLETKEGSFLLDCGNGALSKLQEYADFRQLQGVILTHFHPDHYMDIFSLRHAIGGSLRDGSRKERLKLFLPSSPKEEFLKLYDYKEVFEVIPIESLKAEDPICEDKVRALIVGELVFKFHPTKHPLLTYAIMVCEKNEAMEKVFVYSSDTAYKKQLVEFFNEADLLIIEASLQEKDKASTKVGHLTAKEAALLAKEAKVKKALLTHFWPEYDLSITLKEAKEVFPSIELAIEGNNYEV